MTTSPPPPPFRLLLRRILRLFLLLFFLCEGAAGSGAEAEAVALSSFRRRRRPGPPSSSSFSSRSTSSSSSSPCAFLPSFSPRPTKTTKEKRRRRRARIVSFGGQGRRRGSSVSFVVVSPASLPSFKTVRSSSVPLSAASRDDSDDDEGDRRRPAPPPPPRPEGVTLKMAFDASPRWAVADDSEVVSERFASEQSLDMVHRLRALSDCVLVGRGTVERDDCTLTVRRGVKLEEYGREGRPPARVVVDPNLRILKREKEGGGEDAYAMLRDGLPVIVYHSSSSSSGSESSVMSLNDAVTLVDLSSSDNEKTAGGGSQATTNNYLSPTSILSDLSSRGIHHVMVEGGPATALSFLDASLVDRAIIVRAPVTFKEPVLSCIDEGVLERAGLEEVGTRTFGDDVVHYWVRRGEAWPTDELSDWP